MIHNLYKQRGETPLECIQRFVANNPDLKGQKMTYLGRLDPLAEGVLLVGSGEDTKQDRREKFFGLDKEYDFVALFGFATDTYDVLGKILRAEKLKNLNELDLIKLCQIYHGEKEQKYPAYSSKVISSRESFSSEIKKINIYKLEFNGLQTLNSKELFGRLLMDVSKVRGDFRQHEILVLWNKILEGYKEEKMFLGRFSAHVSSGTYIRGIVNDMGNTLGLGATTLSIKRTRVGGYQITDSLI